MRDSIFLSEMGSRIALRRKELYLTQEQLAEKMGVSLQTVSCIELGKKAIRPENLVKLCICLNISSEYILYGKRTESQMNDTVSKLSKLPQEEYQTIQALIELLYRKNS